MIVDFHNLKTTCTVKHVLFFFGFNGPIWHFGSGQDIKDTQERLMNSKDQIIAVTFNSTKKIILLYGHKPP